MTPIDALIVRPDGTAVIESIDGDWHSIKNIIDGWLEAVGGELGSWTCYGDEEGRLKNLPANPAAAVILHAMGSAPVIPCGTVVFVGQEYIGGEDGYTESSIPQSLRDMVE